MALPRIVAEDYDYAWAPHRAGDDARQSMPSSLARAPAEARDVGIYHQRFARHLFTPPRRG